MDTVNHFNITTNENSETTSLANNSYVIADSIETSKGSNSEAWVGETYVTTGSNGLGKSMPLKAPVGYFDHEAIVGDATPKGENTSESEFYEWVMVGAPPVP